jgi:hypothetical protein
MTVVRWVALALLTGSLVFAAIFVGLLAPLVLVP